jgi:hypothetical protein
LSGSRAKRLAADRLEVMAKAGIADGALALKRGHDRGCDRRRRFLMAAADDVASPR